MINSCSITVAWVKMWNEWELPCIYRFLDSQINGWDTWSMCFPLPSIGSRLWTIHCQMSILCMRNGPSSSWAFFLKRPSFYAMCWCVRGVVAPYMGLPPCGRLLGGSMPHMAAIYAIVGPLHVAAPQKTPNLQCNSSLAINLMSNHPH